MTELIAITGLENGAEFFFWALWVLTIKMLQEIKVMIAQTKLYIDFYLVEKIKCL